MISKKQKRYVFNPLPRIISNNFSMSCNILNIMEEVEMLDGKEGNVCLVILEREKGEMVWEGEKGGGYREDK